MIGEELLMQYELLSSLLDLDARVPPPLVLRPSLMDPCPLPPAPCPFFQS